MSRFTLQCGRWYARELIGDEFDEDKCSYSPIKVQSVEPRHTGERTFRLRFYHANYPEGVRGKNYALQMKERCNSMLIARSQEHDPPRFLQICDITADWISMHFPGWNPSRRDIQGWLDRNA